MNYEMNDNKVLGNAMLDISKKEGRYIIGSDDLRNYSQILVSRFAEDRVHLALTSACMNGSIYNLSGVNTNFLMPLRKNGYLEPHCRQYADYYMMVPWISREDLLVTYRSSFPLDAMFWKDGADIIEAIPVISNEMLEEMNQSYQLGLESFREMTNSTLENYETEVKTLRRRLELINNKLNGR